MTFCSVETKRKPVPTLHPYRLIAFKYEFCLRLKMWDKKNFKKKEPNYFLVSINTQLLIGNSFLYLIRLGADLTDQVVQ